MKNIIKKDIKYNIKNNIKSFVYEYSSPLCNTFIDYGKNIFLLKGFGLIMSYVLKKDDTETIMSFNKNQKI